MHFSDFDPAGALFGGALLGASTAMGLWLNGRSEGVSGIYGAFVARRAPDDRLAFVLGLIAAGLAARLLSPQAFGAAVQPSLPLLGLAGFLVGFGTRLGSGCTSGHGIAGLARLSARSLVAVLTFIAAGAVTVASVRLLSEAS